jgi:ketosteroid isomerase-like protein
MTPSVNDTYLADRIALTDVMARYAAGVDDRDLVLYRACFADDVEVLGFGDSDFHGADAWTAYVAQALERYAATQHMLGPVLAVIDGDTAHCRTDVQALHYLKDRPGTTLTLWATYVTDLRRIDGAWKIRRHRLLPRGTRVQSDPEQPA